MRAACATAPLYKRRTGALPKVQRTLQFGVFPPEVTESARGMTDQSIYVGLSAWMIQDSYDDFRVGMDVAFALEFYSKAGLRRVEGPSKQRLTHLGGSEYEASGQIIHRADDWWVIDFGIPASRDEVPPEHLQIGDWVQGRIYLRIAPHFCRVYLDSSPDAPPLIAEWRVDRIQMQTAPFIKQGNFRFRDPALIGWRDIAETDGWEDDGGSAEYVLTCARTT